MGIVERFYMRCIQRRVRGKMEQSALWYGLTSTGDIQRQDRSAGPPNSRIHAPQSCRVDHSSSELESQSVESCQVNRAALINVTEIQRGVRSDKTLRGKSCF